MAAAKGNQYAKGAKGNSHAGCGAVIVNNFNKYQGQWWEAMEPLIKKGDRWALAEFNKIQVKLIPQENINKNETVISISDEDRKVVQEFLKGFSKNLKC